jgi:tetratricopeptide (TPR) repeat protein
VTDLGTLGRAERPVKGPARPKFVPISSGVRSLAVLFGLALAGPAAAQPSGFVSSRAYYHHLRSRIAELRGEEEAARRDVGLALLYDDRSPSLRARAARGHLARGRSDRAQEVARGLPDPLLRARLALSRGRVEQAERELGRALRQDRLDGRGFVAVLEGLREAGRSEQASKAARTALPRLDQRGAAHLARWARRAQAWALEAEARGRALSLRGPVTPAVGPFGSPSVPGGGTGEAPGDVFAWVEALHRVERAAEADPVLSRWSARSPGDLDVLWARIARAAWQGDAEGVDRLARRAYQLTADRPGRQTWSDRLGALGFPEVALRWGRPKGRLAARRLFEARRPALARRILARAEPADPALEARAVESLLEAGRPRAALAWSERRLPDHAAPALRLRARVRAGQPEAATRWIDPIPDPARRQAFARWIEGRPSAPDDAAASLRLELARRTGALSLGVLEPVVAPSIAERAERAWYGYLERDRPPEDTLRRLWAEAPDHPTVLWARGRVALRRGASARAVRYLERATRLAPADGRFWEGLGDARCEAEHDGAQQAYRQAERAFRAAWRAGRLWTEAPAKRAARKAVTCSEPG